VKIKVTPNKQKRMLEQLVEAENAAGRAAEGGTKELMAYIEALEKRVRILEEKGFNL